MMRPRGWIARCEICGLEVYVATDEQERQWIITHMDLAHDRVTR